MDYCERGVNTSDLIKIHNIKNNYLASNCAEKYFSSERLQKGILWIQYSTLLHLSPLRFHRVGGCQDRTQDFVIDKIFCTVSFEMKGKRGRRKLRGSKCQNLCCMSQKYIFLSQRGTLKSATVQHYYIIQSYVCTMCTALNSTESQKIYGFNCT